MGHWKARPLKIRWFERKALRCEPVVGCATVLQPHVGVGLEAGGAVGRRGELLGSAGLAIQSGAVRRDPDLPMSNGECFASATKAGVVVSRVDVEVLAGPWCE